MKYIKGFEGRYSVTEDGCIWSHPKPLSGFLEGRGYKPGRWVKTTENKGYLYVRFGLRDQPKLLHRVVAETYLFKPKGKDHVNHKNGIKSDNRVENLEWCTQKENNQHGWRTGLLKPNRKIPKSEYKNIIKLYSDGLTHKEIAGIYNCGASTIGRTLKWAIQDATN